MRPDSAIQFWESEIKPLWAGMTLIRGGGHFTGSTMLHWPAGAETGRLADRRHHPGCVGSAVCEFHVQLP